MTARSASPALLALLALAGGVVLALKVAEGQADIERSPAWAPALRRAEAHEAVLATLGAPLEAGFPTGRATPGSLSAQVKVQGPRRSAALFIDAVEHDGGWRYERLEVQLGPSWVVDLREAAR